MIKGDKRTTPNASGLYHKGKEEKHCSLAGTLSIIALILSSIVLVIRIVELILTLIK